MSFYLKRRERIIQTAIEIIDELGFQGLSTKEICKRQEVSEGTLYKHFRSKNEVILGVLDYYLKFDTDIKETIEIKRLLPKESIRFMALRLAEYYQNYPAITAIPSAYEVFRHEEGVSSKVNEIFTSRNSYLAHIIEKGIKQGEFPADTDSEALADIILGSGRAVILKWRMQNFNFQLKEKLIHIVEMLLQAY